MQAPFNPNQLELELQEPVYKDSTPHLHVGDSAFESWFQAQPFATQTGIKQISRDSYAAGMGDPLVVAASQQQAEPVQGPFDDLATELFVVAQISPVDDGFSDTIDRIESWLQKHFSTQPQRKPLTDGEFAYVWHQETRRIMGTDKALLLRAKQITEAAHGIKEL